MLSISIFYFANETILFCDPNIEQILYIRMVLICFKALIGLNVNLGKSEAAPIGRVGNIIKLAYILHCKVGGACLVVT